MYIFSMVFIPVINEENHFIIRQFFFDLKYVKIIILMMLIFLFNNLCQRNLLIRIKDNKIITNQWIFIYIIYTCL